MRTDTDRREQVRTGAAARPDHRRAAFTLMELLVVIAIMAVISTIAVGGYFGMTRAAAYASAHDNVYNTLVLTRQRAVIDGKVTSLILLNATNYIVVRAVGRISHIDGGFAHDAYSDLSGALGTIDVYNLDSTTGVAFQNVTISEIINALQLTDVLDQSYVVAKGYRFSGAGFFAVGDRYGFALHTRQSLPRGYRFTGTLPREIRFDVDGSCANPPGSVTIEERIRTENTILFDIAASGTITESDPVKKPAGEEG